MLDRMALALSAAYRLSELPRPAALPLFLAFTASQAVSVLINCCRRGSYQARDSRFGHTS